MGTNFYLADGTHLGKRSASGHYCYDCDLSLVTGQPGGYNPSADPATGDWHRHEACPGCSATRQNPDFYLPELFHPTEDQTQREEASGPVRYSHAFSFALAPERIAAFPARKRVRDEYGHQMSMREFRAMVEGAKFLRTGLVGREFC